MKSLNEEFGTSLSLSKTFHPQIDKQSEKVIQILEDMPHACIMDFKISWVEYLTLGEFSCNNSFSRVLVWLHSRLCIEESADFLLIFWDEVG